MSHIFEQLTCNCQGRAYMTGVIFNAIRDGNFTKIALEEGIESIAAHTLLAVLMLERAEECVVKVEHGIRFDGFMQKIGRNRFIDELIAMSTIGENLEPLFDAFAGEGLGTHLIKTESTTGAEIEIDWVFIQKYGFATMALIIAAEAYVQVMLIESDERLARELQNMHLGRVLAETLASAPEVTLAVAPAPAMPSREEMEAWRKEDEVLDEGIARFLQEDEDGAACIDERAMHEREQQIAADAEFARRLESVH